RGVARVRARGDRRDHDVAVPQVTRDVAHAQLAGALHGLVVEGEAPLLVRLAQVLPELALYVGQADAVLRALRAGDRGLDRAEVQLDHVAVHGVGRGVVAPQHVRLGVALDGLDLVRQAAGLAEVPEGLGVDREEADGRPVL